MIVLLQEYKYDNFDICHKKILIYQFMLIDKLMDSLFVRSDLFIL